MTDTAPSTPAPDNEEAKPASCKRKKSCCLIFPVLVLALVVAWLYCPWLAKYHPQVVAASPDAALVKQRLAAVEQKIQELDGKLGDLNTRVTNLPAPAAKEEPSDEEEKPAKTSAPSAATSAAITHMQGDLAALSATVTGLQGEVKQAGSAAAETQQAMQQVVRAGTDTTIAAIAFIQLRETAAAGRGFSGELAALRGATAKYPAFQEPLSKLDPYAAKGAVTLDALREEFLALEPAASQAIDKAAAQTWWEHAMAELKGLVSVRPLHGSGAADDFTNAEAALMAGDLPAALAAVKELPQPAAVVLKDWLEKAEARATVDEALHMLVDRFLSPSMSLDAAPAQDKP